MSNVNKSISIVESGGDQKRAKARYESRMNDFQESRAPKVNWNQEDSYMPQAV